MAARGLVEWKNELVTALGGEENISPQEHALLEMIVRTRILIDGVDAFLLGQETMVNKKKRAILPALRERQSLVDSFARLLGQLGLKRREKPIPSLHEYLAEKREEVVTPANPKIGADFDPRELSDNTEPGATLGGSEVDLKS
jgi:hypothetical protein